MGHERHFTAALATSPVALTADLKPRVGIGSGGPRGDITSVLNYPQGVKECPVMGEKVAEGTWYYDGSVPRRIAVLRKEARFASSRFNHDTDDEPTVDESRPIPATKDGYLYFCFPANSGEHLSLDEVKAWADAQPWGPVRWDDEA